MTLHYYSPKAYEFVRRVLKLPHASSIKTWAASVDCKPGYLTNVINAIGELTEKKMWMQDIVLIVDAMSIHKMTIYDQSRKSFVGLVDYGTAIPEANATEATEALVFMIVGLTGNWKHPIGYVLQDKCSANVQAQLIRDCIGLLHEKGLKVHGLVFDGSPTNQSTARKLGCKMNVGELKHWFPHPQQPSSKVYVIFDVCHMIKLIRNLLGHYGTICHEENGILKEIRWEYLDLLYNLQHELGFAFANKLKKKHLLWQKHKMNVKLAAQTLSSSVASAIDFLRDEALLPEFQGSEATCEFIKRIDLAFDLMNSRNSLEKGSKQAVTLQYLPYWMSKCDELAEYIFNLRTENGNYLRRDRRQTAIWGFVFSMHSVKAIAGELLQCNYHPYKYVLTYKVSQDHIELLFNKIRWRGSWSNNPNAQQFKLALRQIIIRNSIEPSKTGNCTNFDDALCESQGLPDFSWKRSQKVPEQVVEGEDENLLMAERVLFQNDLDNPNLLQDNILYYVAGYLVKSLCARLNCRSCQWELLLDPTDCHASKTSVYPLYARFVAFKQKGGLIFPSLAVIKIVKATEVVFRRRVVDHGIGISSERNIGLKIQNAVLDIVGTSVFKHTQHYYEHTVGERDHLSSLLKMVTKQYLDVRMNTYAKKYTAEVVHKNIPSNRHHLTRTILFSNL